MNRVTILGSTGSIGKQTLSVIQQNPELFQVEALVAKKNVEILLQQCLQFKPTYAVLTDKNAAQQLRDSLQQKKSATQVLLEPNAMQLLAQDSASNIVVAAIVGSEGLVPTMAAVKAGKKILLANKEALVMSGQLFIEELKKNNSQLLPVDSEHSAIWQCLPKDFIPGISQSTLIKNIVLTASGGPLLAVPLEKLSQITPAQAIAHPKWNMGPKISVDSATMMNKGLEVIEAHCLFNIPAEKIEVIIHPQSIIHSLVRYGDGSVLAHMGLPDMRTPIAVALAWPKRIISGVKELDLVSMGNLEFQAMDYHRFPALTLAFHALKAGKSAANILNAANEAAVALFLDGRIRFDQIVNIIEQSMEQVPNTAANNLEEILYIDQETRRFALNYAAKSLLV